MKIFFNSLFNRISRTIIAFFKPLFITFWLGNLLIFKEVLKKPTFEEWCIGTMFLLVGGGAIHVSKGLQEKFINKG